MDVSSVFPVILSVAGMLILKCVLLHYSMKFSKWLGIGVGKSEPPTKKCNNIYEYNFLDEYESEAEDTTVIPSEKVQKTDALKSNDRNNDDTRSNQFTGDQKLQETTQKLLATIRQRQEKTASALRNCHASMSTNVPKQRDGKGQREREEEQNDLLKNSKYFAYLSKVIQDRDHVEMECNKKDK